MINNGATDVLNEPGSSAPRAARAPKKNKPKNTRFRQQKLAAWQPILTASTVIPVFLIVGIVFVPIGAVLISVSADVQEHVFNYTTCTAIDDQQDRSCAEILSQSSVVVTPPCRCNVSMRIDEAMNGDVYFYYALTNFYQNHRRYVRSRNDDQLLGNLDSVADCSPFDKVGGKLIVPCGAIASSMFNDTFTMTIDDTDVPWTSEGVAWDVDVGRKFNNPSDMTNDTWGKYAKPETWTRQANELDTNPNNNGFRNVDFMVWMRTAALPNFRKLYRRLVRTASPYGRGLPAGTYHLLVNYSFPVASFSGEKKFVISTTSFMGAKNSFLGIAYVITGSLCLLLALAFAVIHLKFGKSMTVGNNVRAPAAAANNTYNVHF